MYMTTLSVADARARFSQLVVAAASNHERFAVTRNGNRTAALLGADDYDGLVETVAILSDSETVAALRQGIQELGNGNAFDADEVRAATVPAGRLPAWPARMRFGSVTPRGAG